MIFWTVENGETVRFERTGECNQCGECCRGKSTITYEARLGVTAAPEDDETVDWSPWEGWNFFWAQGHWFYLRIWFDADKETSCESLTEDGLCAIHEEFTKKPLICTYWPMHPSHVKAFPSCSYSFERIEEDAVGDA